MARHLDLELRRLQTRVMIDLARIRHASEPIVEALLRSHALEQITPAQANALLLLVNAREPRTAADLAREMGVSEVTVGRFVRAMEEAGWVERIDHPTDSRAWLLRPTARAREALPRFIRVSNALLDRAFDGLEAEQIRAIAAWTGRVRENLDPDP